MNQTWDVIIIGGGLSGYVAANYLTKAGLSILILERGNKAGGRACTDIIKGQFFNLGPHALYKKGKAKPILEELGISLSGKSPKIGGTIIEKGFEYAAPFSPFGLLTTNLLKGKGRLEWVRALMKVMNADSYLLEKQTFEQYVLHLTPSKKVHSLLYLLGRLATYCHAPELVSAKVMVNHLKLVIGGVLYLDGGWQTMIDQLNNKAVISGVQVQNGKAVKHIIKADHLFHVMLTDDKEFVGKYVLSTTGPNELGKMLSNLDAFPHIRFAPVKGATLDVALTRLPHPRMLFALGLSEPLYYSVHSGAAKLSADGKSSVLHVFKYHHPDDEIDPTSVKIELEQFLEKLQPGWQSYLITSRFLPQITVNQRLPKMDDGQQLNRSKTEIPGLYIAGDWTSPDYMLSEGAVYSGKCAAEEIIQSALR